MTSVVRPHAQADERLQGGTSGVASILEGAIREMVRQEVRSAIAGMVPDREPAAEAWMTPPAAARAVGISEKAIRRMIKKGAILARLRNIETNPRQPKFLVNVDAVSAEAERVSRVRYDGAEPQSLAQKAARIRAKTEGR